MPRRNKAPYLQFMDNTRVRDAFKYLTSLKDQFIVIENGEPVSVKEAVRRYKASGDDCWPLHILMSNLGYFANALSKVAARWGIDPADYIPDVYEGLRRSMERADENIVKLSYLSTGVYMWCRKRAEAEVRERTKEGRLEEVVYNVEDEEVVGDLDAILATQGIYEVPLDDYEP